MARTSNIFARVEPEVKEQAELVLEQLGIPMSNAIGLFLRQIVLQRGIPFELKLPQSKPPSVGTLTEEQFNAEIEKGLADLTAGRVVSAEKAFYLPVEAKTTVAVIRIMYGGRDIEEQLRQTEAGV